MSPKPDQHDGRKLRGFTIVELLIVIAVIILLLSILIVAVNAATRTAQSASTLTLMNSMKQALVRFKADIGYYPPVLGEMASPPDLLRAWFEPPDPASAGYANDIQNWWSSAVMAEFLIGYDEGRYDGYGYVDLGETPTLGIRDPGPDGVWGGSVDRNLDGMIDLEDRNPPLDGTVYGPYLELKDQRLIAGVMYLGGNLQTYFPGDAVPDGLSFEDLPKAIVDYWGQPIRYFRQVYRSGDIRSVYRSLDPNVPTPTLADVFVLRPFDLKPGSAIDGIADNNPDIPGGDSSTTHALRTAEFALLSAGPDRALNQDVRRDEDEFNKDNIVELGP